MKLELRAGEPVGHGLGRISTGLLADACRRLQAPHPSPASVHETRKNIKKLRAVMRLGRAAIGERSFRAANRAVRDAGRALADVRDADVMLRALQSIEPARPSVAAAAEWRRARSEFRAGRVSARSADAGRQFRAARTTLESVSRKAGRWRLGRVTWPEAIEAITRTYRNGCRALAAALERADDDALHEFRKRVKDLGYQLRVMRGLWPPVVDAMESELGKLAELLGDDHDLAVMETKLARARGVDEAGGFEAIRSALRVRRGGLRGEALGLGRRLFAEKPRAFGGRLERWWLADDAAVGPGPSSPSTPQKAERPCRTA